MTRSFIRRNSKLKISEYGNAFHRYESMCLKVLKDCICNQLDILDLESSDLK